MRPGGQYRLDRSYVTLERVYHRHTGKAVLLSSDRRETDTTWVPLSLTRAASPPLDGLREGTEVEIEVVEWKARELGWA